jgi:hypothetical protein
VHGGRSQYSRCCYLIIDLGSRLATEAGPGVRRSHLISAVELGCSNPTLRHCADHFVVVPQWFKWVYDDTSAEAHLAGVGLFSLAPFLLAELADAQTRQMIEKRTYFQYHARHFSRTIMTVLAIATEIDAQFKLNNHAAIAYIWRIIVEYAPDANDMYEGRYRAMLS